MKRKRLFLIIWGCFFAAVTWAQHVDFADDKQLRGWYDRPYLRYEAEPERCITNGMLLEPTYLQNEVQSEASNQQAVQLIEKGAYVQWTNTQAADGITIRFSLPDNDEGLGIQGTLALYVNDVFTQNFTLDSFWAWQYFQRNMSNSYPDNTPASDKFPRMRFDEMHWKLEEKIPANATFRLVKTDENEIPYTIDFVELEEVPEMLAFESIPDENKVAYSPDKGALNYFISGNQGKTIYIPAGRYEVDNRIFLSGNNTQILGAGMWYTEIYFTASSDERGTYNQRGIEASGSNIVVDGLFLNTVNNKRYYQTNSQYQVGKGLMGSFGSGSIIRNVWIDHFECGGWIDGADRLTISDCRFRNNYADGMNLSYGSKNSVVERCSFRNNGDDDMASWSRSNRLCENNVYRYCTAENNWRASSLGFFGGKQNKAHDCVIIDPMEAGIRVTCDFPGMPFSADGYNEYYNISVYKGGVKSGTRGMNGDLWGNQQGAIHLNSSSQYDLQNFKIYNIDLYDSKNDAIFIGSGSRKFVDVLLKNITINGTGRHGIYFNSSKGAVDYCNILFTNVGGNETGTCPSGFSFEENCDEDSSVDLVSGRTLNVYLDRGSLIISDFENSLVSIFDITDRMRLQTPASSDLLIIRDLLPGIYFVQSTSCTQVKKVILN